MKFINDYPYTNMTAQNIDWLIKAVVDLIHQGKTDEEIKNAPGISEAYGAFCNAYPYTNMTMQNIDWLISSVRELYDKEATLEETVTKIEAQIKTLQTDVANITTKLDDKVDKTTEPTKIYGTDPDGMPFLYTQTATETTLYSVPLRNDHGAIVAAAAQQGDEVVNLTQMNTALADKVDKTTARQVVYARNSEGNEIALSYDSEATVGVAVRGQNGVLKVGTPVANDDATTKKYVDNALDNKVDKTTEHAKLYGTGADGEPHLYEQNATEVIPWSIPMRNGTGALVAANPTLNNELTTKEYVDNAIATAPVSGWTTIIDKTWTEDEAATTSKHLIAVSIPEQYRKPMKALRITAYMDTPETGEIYKDTASGSRDGMIYFRDWDSSTNRKLSCIKGLPSQKTGEGQINVNFQSDYNKTSTVFADNSGNGTSDLYNGCYGIYVYRDSNGNAVQPIPTDPNVLLNTSNIIGTAEVPEDKTPKVLDTCLPNRSHSYTSNNTQTTVNYTSNDYYNSGLPECIISQVLTSTDTTNLPVGSFICVQRGDLRFALRISIVFSGTASVGYKSITISESAIIGETIINTMRVYTKRNTMTSFDQFDASITVDTTDMYTNPCSNGYPTALYIYPGQSGGETATSKYIMYKGSRLIVQAQY